MSPAMNKVLKRLFDVIASGVALVLLLPVFLVIAVFVKLDSRGPIMFRQKRLGKGGRLFELCKFRTMVHEAEGRGPIITLNGDPRVTRVGRVLRGLAIDELPNLLNVFKGDMSIVGPRPEVPEFLPYYTEEQRRVLSVKPGLTDLGTLAFRDEIILLAGEDPKQVYIDQILPRKLTLNLEYIQRQSLGLDLAIIIRTLGLVLTRSKRLSLFGAFDLEKIDAGRKTHPTD